MSDSIVIIPTYNEKENAEAIVRAVMVLEPEFHVLIVDDGSPDGTAKIIQSLQSEFEGRLFLEQRKGKLGLGTAYIHGFKWALDREYEFIFEMDADFSHNPSYLPQFLKEIENYDLVVGSRYVKGVTVVNWPMSRLLLSYFANMYARFITGIPLHDATGGFKCFRASALRSLNLNRIHSDGYSFQIEVNYKLWKKGFRIQEIPIIFVDRTAGQSKMSSKIIKEALFLLVRLRFGGSG